jgi:hypothetical protein
MSPRLTAGANLPPAGRKEPDADADADAAAAAAPARLSPAEPSLAELTLASGAAVAAAMAPGSLGLNRCVGLKMAVAPDLEPPW